MRSFFQTNAWAEFKERSGWHARRFGEGTVLRRVIKFNLSLEYAPELPFSEEVLAQLEQDIAQPNSAIFSRYEFLEPWSFPLQQRLERLGLRKSFEEVQPEFRQWIDLDLTEAALLAQMKPKGRYNIRVAERYQLEVDRGTAAGLIDEFYALYKITSERNEFSGRSRQYFVNLVALLEQQSVGEVLVVRYQSKAVAAGIFLYWGGVGSYLYGASAEPRNVMGPYLLHWEAIKEAKRRGCQVYDLLAIAPPDQPSHHYAALTRFKSQFGGRSVRLLGSWDFIRKPFWYTIYRALERRRRQILR